MKILFVSHSAEIGGAENMLLQLIRIAQKEGFECHCVFPKPGILEEEARKLNVITHISKIKWCVEVNGKPLLHFHEGLNERVEAIKRIIQLNNIDLVVTNTAVIIAGALAARLAGVPHVWRIAELLSDDPSLKSVIDLKLFYSLILSLSEQVLVVAEAVKKEMEQFIGITSQKIVVIYDGLAAKDILNKEPSSKENIVFSAGNICPRKGFKTLLKAAWYVRQHIPGVKFLVAGRITDSIYYKELLKLRKKLNLGSTFEFCGFQKDVYSFLRRSNVFVLASTSEPFGVVLLEAMSVGLPIVTTNSGGPAEAVIDGKTGFVVSIDDEKTMAERIRWLLANKENANQMGRDGHIRLLEVFSLEKMEFAIGKMFKNASLVRAKNDAITLSLSALLNIISSIQVGEGKIPEMVEFYCRVKNNKLYKILYGIKKRLHI